MTRLLPRSLRTLTLLFLLIFVAAISLLGVTSYLATRQTLYRLVDQRLAEISRTLVGRAPHRLSDIYIRVAAAARQRDTGDLGLVLRGQDGHVLFANIVLTTPLPIGFANLGKQAGIEGLTEGRALTLNLDGAASLTTIAETEPIDNYNAARVGIYLFGYGSVVILVLGGVAVFAEVIAGRISLLNRTAQAIIDGDLSRRVPDMGSCNEFDMQARTFNLMLDRITELMSEIGGVTNDIAHDLRTPLARLRGELAVIARHTDDPQTRSGLQNAITQSDELLNMFQGMLRIGELEAGNRRARFVPLDLAKLAAEAADALAPVATDARHTLAVTSCGLLMILGDRALLVQMVVNLIENAIMHTPPGTRIQLRSAASGGLATLDIVDDGPGIPADRRTLAMRRFGRLDSAREGGGHGLGLALVQAIARLHHGDVELMDAHPGLRVSVTIPLLPD